ncbi:hypothetical protein N7489_006397 [Penicillium chrysogenum]|uniref:uncharacterized protein n=1 Tax=Penicillium chrysogenum TaxID=5076 RepID=UPI0024DF2840|nr:uncharacterized protein N7489_006397 [Penicillium chrysogenum]KAJ5236306.1 hypothetical protein N7489_006397 [Penicillium chrysogenum]
MPHKVNNSNSTLASRGSSNDQQPIPSANPPVVIHNKGGRIYDETRPSDWDKQRWK